MSKEYTTYAAPCGSLWLVAECGAVCGVWWHDGDYGHESTGDNVVLARLVAQLDEYFAGTRRVFDVPQRAAGTAFQREVWQALAAIPYGSTTTYSAVAHAMGRPRAVRAVARAIGANPLSVLVPCHRVIGSNGTLTGYAGGLPAKRWLLRHESANANLGDNIGPDGGIEGAH